MLVSLPFVVKTEASDIAIAATMSVFGTFSSKERYYSTIENKAHTVIQCVCKWHHYPVASRFSTFSNHRPVSFSITQFSLIPPNKVVKCRGVLNFLGTLTTSSTDNENNVAIDGLSRACCGLSRNSLSGTTKFFVLYWRTVNVAFYTFGKSTVSSGRCEIRYIPAVASVLN